MHPETNSLVAVKENISLAEGLRAEVSDKWMIQVWKIRGCKMEKTSKFHMSGLLLALVLDFERSQN